MSQTKRFEQGHPVRQLFADLASDVPPYPDGVVKVEEQILGTAFFPGGSGLWCEEADEAPSLPIGKIMILGQDFDTLARYKQTTKLLSERLNRGTWGVLRRTLYGAGIRLVDCFFTNAYMGLRKDGPSTGRFIGAKDGAFTERCRRFFVKQVYVQRPRVIFTLGKFTPAFIAPLSPKLSHWRNARTFNEIDKLPLVRQVSFDSLPDHRCAVACLTHPSLRHLNVCRRRWRTFNGVCAESELIREALSEFT